jgi:hypothetical protein
VQIISATYCVGRSDVLFLQSDAALAIFLINGFQIVAGQVRGGVGTEWTIAGDH